MVHFQQTGLAHTTFFHEWLAYQLISRNDSIFNTTAGMAHFLNYQHGWLTSNKSASLTHFSIAPRNQILSG
jgi:hypothetical protein